MNFRELLAIVMGCGEGAVMEEDVEKCQLLYLAWAEVRNFQDGKGRPHELADSEAALVAALVGVPARERKRQVERGPTSAASIFTPPPRPFFG